MSQQLSTYEHRIPLIITAARDNANVVINELNRNVNRYLHRASDGIISVQWKANGSRNPNIDYMGDSVDLIPMTASKQQLYFRHGEHKLRQYNQNFMPEGAIAAPKYREISINGTDYITHLPQDLIELLGEPLDLTETIGNRFTYSAMDAWHHSSHDTPYWIDQVGDISFLGAFKGKLLQALPENTKIKTIRLKRLYRGGGDHPDVSIAEQTTRQVLSGGRLFLFSIDSGTYNYHGSRLDPQKILCLGIVESMIKAVNYDKSERFFNALHDAFQNGNSLPLLDKEAWKAKMFQQHAQYLKYHPGIAKEFNLSSKMIEEISFDFIEHMERSSDYYKNSDLAKVDPPDYSSTVTGRKLTRMQDALKKHQARVNTATVSQSRASRNLNQTTRNISNYESELIALKGQLEKFIALHEESKAQKSKLIKATPGLKESVSKADSDHQAYLNTLTSTNSIDWEQRFRDRNIIIQKIIFTSRLGSGSVNLRANPEVLRDNDWYLSKIIFLTTKPSIIRVGGSEDNLRVAGPFQVMLSKDSPYNPPYARVKAACLGSVIGMHIASGQIHATVHPHCEAVRVKDNASSLRSFMHTEHNACLGELAPALTHAFNANRVRNSIFSFMAWVEACNPDDYWGKHCTWFPKPEDVNMTGEIENPKVDTSDPEELDITLVKQVTNRFWQVAVSGKTLTSRTGKIGMKGRTFTKELLNNRAAIKLARENIERKLQLGFVEQ